MKVFQQLGAIDQTLAMMTIVHNVAGDLADRASCGDRATRAEWLPRLASGRELVAFAITEPAAGSNPPGMVSTAHPTARRRGAARAKELERNGGLGERDQRLRAEPRCGRRARGISGFAVPRDTPGLRMGPEALTLGMRGMVQNTIYLEGARVTRGAVPRRRRRRDEEWRRTP